MAIWDVGDAELDGPAPLPQLDDDALPTCMATISSGQIIYRSESFAVG
jgi:hypothetical protein